MAIYTGGKVIGKQADQVRQINRVAEGIQIRINSGDTE